MKFREPDPFYFEWPVNTGGSFQSVLQQMEALPIENVILFWAIIVIITAILVFLISPRYRWKILMAVIRTAVLFIALTFVLKALAENIPWISYFISLILVYGILFLGWWLWNLGTRPYASVVRQNIADIARQTLKDFADGRDFGDTVTTCYVRMIDAVKMRHGFQRQEGMTPSEFASRLEAAGLPGEPVRQLTLLFEGVRYGARKPGENETREAVTCLNAIIDACGDAS
jgi:hypothetical protein